MEHIYMRILVRKWSCYLNFFFKFMFMHVPTSAYHSYAPAIYCLLKDGILNYNHPFNTSNFVYIASFKKC